MTVQLAILIGALIIGVSIVGARVIAPYEIASSSGVAWRVNTVTGAIFVCDATGTLPPLINRCSQP
jgi:hypothetical protein